MTGQTQWLVHREFLPHVFERFRQESTSTTRKYGGLGLGLAIVHHLTKLHGNLLGKAYALYPYYNFLSPCSIEYWVGFS